MKKIITCLFTMLICIGVFAQESKYKIGDKGPGGGFIFYAEDGEFREVSVSLNKNKYVTWYEAKKLAQNYRGGGFKDWRLPTLEELYMIYNNLNPSKEDIAKLGYHSYWSSTECDPEIPNTKGAYAIGGDHDAGGLHHCSWADNRSNTVRVVRSFKIK